MLNKIKQHKVLIILVIIVFLAFLIRVWNIQELFVFKMDQARDINLVQEAYDGGVGELPLLGPRAAKTYLRLGPIFYYFEYLSMWVTGNKSPLSVVWPDFILSILTIPLFYYFLRQVFSKKTSLMTTAVFASSFFLTQYSRFAWNPNSIPFWSLLFFLGMYKVMEFRYTWDKSQKSKIKSSIAGRWLLVVVLGYGVASQLHFTAMLAYPLVAVLFGLFFYKTKWWLRISWKYWLGTIIILGVFYLPMMFSEICTHGDNWVQFKYALSGREKEEFSLKLKIIQSLKLHSEYFYFSLISFSGGENKFFVWGYLIAMGSVVILVWKGFFANITVLRNTVIFAKKDRKQRNKIIWFVLIFIWFVVIGLLYTKLAFNVLKPRYWLLEMPIFFIWLAVVLEWLYGLKYIFKYRFKCVFKEILVYLIVGVLVVGNLCATGYWYWSVQNQREGQFFLWDLKLKDESKISYGQLEKSTKYIAIDIKRKAEQGNKKICYYTTGEYRPVYDYIFDNYYSKLNIKRISFGSDTNKSCLFLAIDHHQHREIPRIPKNYKAEFEKVKDGKKEIGFITIWEVKRNVRVESQETIGVTVYEAGRVQEKKQEKKTSNVQVGRDVDDNIVEIDSLKKDEEEKTGLEKIDSKVNQVKLEKPRRQERVRWKDVRQILLFLVGE